MRALFGAGSSFETEVEKATSEKNSIEPWDLFMDICDKAGKSSDDSKACLRAIYKRLNNNDPHIQIRAATLLDACVSNCGKVFHTEVASREFENEYTKLLKKCHPRVQQKLKESLKKWADGEFKKDPQLNLIPSLFNKLKNSGTDFTVEMPIKKTMTLSKDPNVVQSEEEEEQIAKAIELSLKETKASPRKTAATNSSPATSLYPSVTLANTSTSIPTSSAPPKELRKVRALYDFEAAEDNELTFSAGEIIFVIDDSDANWWKGSNQRGEGLFPSNFVTADLSAEPEQFVIEKNKKLVHFNDNVEVKNIEPEELQEVEINEEKVDRLLHLLHDADTTNPENDDEEMLRLEKEANAMGPMIDSELEQVDRKHAQLTKLSTDLVEALSLYHSLMREPQFQPVNKMPYHYAPSNQPPSGMYNNTGSLPPNANISPQFMIGQTVSMPQGQQEVQMGPPSAIIQPRPSMSQGQREVQMGPPSAIIQPRPSMSQGQREVQMGPPSAIIQPNNMSMPPHMIYGSGPVIHNNPPQNSAVVYPVRSNGMAVPQQQPGHNVIRFQQQGLPSNYPQQSIPHQFNAQSVRGSQTVLHPSNSSGQIPGQYSSANNSHMM